MSASDLSVTRLVQGFRNLRKPSPVLRLRIFAGDEQGRARPGAVLLTRSARRQVHAIHCASRAAAAAAAAAAAKCWKLPVQCHPMGHSSMITWVESISNPFCRAAGLWRQPQLSRQTLAQDREHRACPRIFKSTLMP